MTSIAENLARVRQRIVLAARQCGRDVAEITLLAVSKTKPAQAIREAHACGQRQFGESYVQEALAKQAALADLDIEWHFIGPIQSNKSRAIAEHFHWVHSVEREKIARRLSDQRPAHLPPLNICLQVNISGEASKSGARPEELDDLVAAVKEMPRLRLRGLMAIPQPAADETEARRPFHAMAVLQAQLAAAHGLALDTLSMGMSGDLEAAIAEGATVVRVGSDIFGARDKAV